MRIFARVAEERSFTAAARELGIPKQTVSRRLAELEAALGVQLVQRTTRRVRVTDVGAAYAERCTEVLRLADEANAGVLRASEVVRGTLRLTADPLFGEAFLPTLIAEYLHVHAEVGVEVMLTQRRVDLIEEGFDVAFRVGEEADSALVGRRLGPARIRYCASPAYLGLRGTPASPDELDEHECIALAPESVPARWLFQESTGPSWRAVSGRLRVNSLALARGAALAGLGIVNLPAFACADDVGAGRLVAVLEPWSAPFGSIAVLYPPQRFLAARVRSFVDLVAERFADPPW